MVGVYGDSEACLTFRDSTLADQKYDDRIDLPFLWTTENLRNEFGNQRPSTPGYDEDLCAKNLFF